MAPLLALVEIAAATTIVIWVVKTFYSSRVSARWWIALGIAILAGGLTGWWLGFRFSYQPVGELVVHSFPVPGAFHVLESYEDGSEQWIGFETPAPILVAVGNASLIMSLIVAVVFGSRYLTLFTRVR